MLFRRGGVMRCSGVGFLFIYGWVCESVGGYTYGFLSYGLWYIECLLRARLGWDGLCKA